MWLKWLPWKFIVRRLARSHGFLDPIALLSYVRRFSQPASVTEPIELLRAGVVFHARGLMNSRAIQQNLDWIWPAWVQRQFDPRDRSFIPRAFSMTHVNLTERNWTAVGVPNIAAYPIVDPCGLLTPHFDGWSLDAWIFSREGRPILVPSRLRNLPQRLEMDPGLAVCTEAAADQACLKSRTWVECTDGRCMCRAEYEGQLATDGYLVISIRPYNPEGVSFIHEMHVESDRQAWRIEDRTGILFDQSPDRHAFSEYFEGDVALSLSEPLSRNGISCKVGMATGAAMFELSAGEPAKISLSIPIEAELKSERTDMALPVSWASALEPCCRLEVPDERIQYIYDAAVRSLILHSPKDVYPGPYTYKRFWFRDAALILNAMLSVGLVDRSKRVIEQFFHRQTATGYFHSQQGEWDSNGQVLWILDRFRMLTGQSVPEEWIEPVYKAARWIQRKRVATSLDAPHAGLFPAGFSAEHLGPIDFYFWDDFWGVGGLRAATHLLRGSHQERQIGALDREAADFMQSIDRSLAYARDRLHTAAMPATPYRRLDSGAIGSLAVGYPLHLWPGDDPRLVATAEYLMDSCLVHGGFFQDMIHSGINPYLTLHLAQILLRGGDGRFADLIRTVAELASRTAQWPEAVHPATLGGCMGDGQHVWASAEWVMMLRHCFLLEDLDRDRPIVAAGILPEWLAEPGPLRFGPAQTPWGPMEIEIDRHDDKVQVKWHGRWRRPPAAVEVRLPGFTPEAVAPEAGSVTLRKGALQ